MPGGDPADVYAFDGGEVLRLVMAPRPEWMSDAACRETPRVNFFPSYAFEVTVAPKAVCESCLVREECLAYALEHDERDGVWGGLSTRERQRLRRKAG